MATNRVRWIRNVFGAAEPLVILAKFQAGATQAIKRGEILEFTGDTSSAFVPIDSDFAMRANVAVANEEIKSGDRAGYYEVIIPRPGDVFEFELASASAIVRGTALYYSSSEKVAVSGTNILGYAVGSEHYPSKQGHLADDAAGDAGTTVRSTSYVRMSFSPHVSYLNTLVPQAESGLPVGGLYSAAQGATPFIMRTLCTAAGAEDEVVVAAMPAKCQIIDAWMIARTTDAANVTLKNATNAFTGAVAIGGVDDTIVSFATIISEYDEVAAAAAITATFSAAGSAEIFLFCIPIP